MKPLIIAPTTLLKNQWVENFEDVGIDRNDIATNIYDSPNKKLTVVTISAIENCLRDDWESLMDVINKSGFGIKVVDEAHLHLKGVLKFDAICNIRYNWYLSATLGRSDFMEDNILNRALSDAKRFIGNAQYEEYQHQYINVYLQDIYYNPTSKLCAEHFKYAGMWKVYGDEGRAQQLFAAFRRCTETYCALWRSGVDLQHLAVAAG